MYITFPFHFQALSHERALRYAWPTYLQTQITEEKSWNWLMTIRKGLCVKWISCKYELNLPYPASHSFSYTLVPPSPVKAAFLTKFQFQEIRSTGEFSIPSVKFPGQVHVWRLSQLLQKGK
jgi:hypothetical protein